MEETASILAERTKELSILIKPKISRTSTSKVRTGCITCKKRHVKCDEAKPKCGNCVRNRRDCEGYVVIKKKRTVSPVQVRWDSKQITRAAPPRAQLHLVNDSLDFKNARGILYFEEFVRTVQSPWIAAGFSTDLWAVILPQVARVNTTVRHAAIAIGALSKWHYKTKHYAVASLEVTGNESSREDADYLDAVAHYCHALRLQSQQASIQDAVFLSMLFLCFEILRGNRKAALDHINHGLAMLLALLTDQDSHLMTSFAPNPKPLIAVLGDIFSHLLPQTRLILRGDIGRSPVIPNFARGLRTKKQTVETFVALIAKLPRSYTPTEGLPAVLDSLDDFEKYWITGRSAKVSIGPILMEAVHRSGILTSTNPNDVSELWKHVTADPRIREICDISTREMRALEAAFMPIFNRAITSDPASTDYIRALHLRMHYLGTYTFDDLTHFYDIELVIAKTPLFREFLSLAEISLRVAKRDLENPAQRLSLQCNLSMNLFLTSLFCRDPLLRDEATWMLKDYPGQDGIWNAYSLYLLALRNRTVERINASEGTALEQWHRLLRREYLFEQGGDRIVLCFLEKDLISGEWQLVEETAEVKSNAEAVQWKRRPLSAAGKPLFSDVLALWPELVE
ncbi:transcription factor [Fusarium heterosporum]|uniref:Transcription factor n=1 Tax=Fusarium heterosporum TaxID=42747 RepID=A0A8H5T184_FUSHE|nr:transcription factor [Fusarium heterosporum]